ncbi:MAG TPA: M1 family metallopeptidase [Intrasporangium sp.]|nr:M1 family metallopeptidase [Intrasporangium sp.]
MGRVSKAATVAALALAVTAAPALAAETVGSPGAGDPFFPLAGNGGLDVANYSLDLAYDPPSHLLSGTATLQVRATQDLSRFDLDLRGFDLGTVTVNGATASVARDGQELVITPSDALRIGDAFTVVVPYSGQPQTVTDPDGSSEGWVYTTDGAAVVGEPQGSPGWYPVNDTPRDKATFTIRMTVPSGLTAVGNGSLQSQMTANGLTTFTWRENYPMAPYLATITLGRFNVTTGTTPSGIPTYVAVDPRQASSASAVLRKLPAMVSFLENLYGSYPFETVGAIVDDAPQLGYSLETQTKPVFDDAPDEVTLLHELSHMWFGDAVTLGSWPDIWLHEGFATWSEWIWTEQHGGKSAAQQFKQLANTPAQQTSFWNPPPGNPGDAQHLFDGTIYERGAMTLEALRERIGDARFTELLRTWYAENRYGTVTTADFVALAERVSGQDLRQFFDMWLYQPGKPPGL